MNQLLIDDDDIFEREGEEDGHEESQFADEKGFQGLE
jgi:hypothetical protein